MPVPKGQRFGGRQKGSLNALNRTAAQILDGLKCDPLTGMARIATGDVPCGTCHGTGKTKYQPAKRRVLQERTCESCYGSGKEKISPELKGKMLSELAKYRHPQLKAVEHSGTVAVSLAANEILESRRKRMESTKQK